MRFLFISDTHFTYAPDIENPVWLNRVLINKWDEMRERVVSELQELKPDAIIHCGDFTHFGTAEDFAFGKAIMDATGVPWYAVPGNHDTVSGAVRNEMQKEFSIAAGNSFCYFKVFGRIAIVFLDVCITRVADKLYSIDDDALSRFESILTANHDKTIFLVCHIPVRYRTAISDQGKMMFDDRVFSGKIFGRCFESAIGKIENVSKIRSIIAQNKNVKIVFSGHWHINSLHLSNNVYYKIVPSICEYPCEVVVADCDDTEIRIHNKAIAGSEFQKDSIISEWNNTWVSGSQKSRNIMIILNPTTTLPTRP